MVFVMEYILLFGNSVLFYTHMFTDFLLSQLPFTGIAMSVSYLLGGNIDRYM